MGSLSPSENIFCIIFVGNLFWEMKLLSEWFVDGASKNFSPHLYLGERAISLSPFPFCLLPSPSPRLGLMPQKSFTIFYSLSPSPSLPLPPLFFRWSCQETFCFLGVIIIRPPLLTFPAGFPTQKRLLHFIYIAKWRHRPAWGEGKNMQTKLFVRWGGEETKNS